MEKNIDFNIAELQEGAVQEKIDSEIQKLMTNILDLNTDLKFKRKLEVHFTFEVTDEKRSVIGVDAQVKTKLAPPVTVGTTMLAGRNLDTGFIEARELNSGTPGQTFISDDGTLKTDVGDVIDEDGNVLDLIDYNKNRKTN